jgi:hypothetical protein
MTVPAELEQRRELMMETVLRQIDAGKDWKQHCRDLMQEVGITNAEVARQIEHRARVMSLTPGLALFTVFIFHTLYVRTAALITCCLVAVAITQLAYQTVLWSMRRDHMHIRIERAVPAGLLLCLLYFLLEHVLAKISFAYFWGHGLTFCWIPLGVEIWSIFTTYRMLGGKEPT